MVEIENFKETYCNSLYDFIELGKSLGKIIPSRKNGKIIDVLTPLKENEVNRNSLSRTYGLNEFPAHTDGAYFRKQPKYILLRYVGELKKVTPTIIVDILNSNLDEDEKDFLKNAVYLVKGIYGSFYSNIYSNGKFRYDKTIMKLISHKEDLMENIINKSKKIFFEWKQNKVLVLNNWNYLHLRPKTKDIENKQRLLQRLTIQ